jgi:hypothetical protein
MSIVINSLTPINPAVASGSTVTFIVDATETNQLQLSYEWQTSSDGVNYSASNLTNNTSSAYTTDILTESDSNTYVRVVISNGIPAETVFSNTYPNIGNRIITVSSSPIILTNVTFNDNYPETTTLQVNQTLSYIVSSALQNLVLTESDTLLQFEWQQSTDSGTTWTTLSNGGNISIVTRVIRFNSEVDQIYKQTELTITNIDFNYNLRQYRVKVIYPGAANNPLITFSRILFVEPTIEITKQPGTGNDTITSFCYKSQTSSSDGKIKLEVDAFSTSQRPLSYFWEFTLDGQNWSSVQEIVDAFNAIYKLNTNNQSSILELERMIYYDTLGFRCNISGSVGENPIFTDEHYVFMKDFEVAAQISSSSLNIIEDKYGDVANRNSFLEAIQRANVITFLNIERNTGLNGNKTLVYEKLMPGSSIWQQVGETDIISAPDDLIGYTLSPPITTTNFLKEHFTNTLRYDIDDGTKYRMKIETTALFNLVNGVKVLQPYYGPEITLNVYRTAYIINQPQDSQVFSAFNASFSVEAVPSSGSIISYQWQYNTTNVSSGWINIPSGGSFSGTNTNILIYSNVPPNPVYRFFRCVITVSNQLSTVTTTVASLITRRDLFTTINNINDIFINEFENAVFQTSATSLSAGQVSYQWEKSVNYNPSAPSTAIWIDISGETTNTLVLNSVNSSDVGFYRCRVTSVGGEISFTNAARLEIQLVNIVIVKNNQTSLNFLEGQTASNQSFAFEVDAYATVGDVINYQWQIKRPGDSDFQNFTSGINNTSATSRFFTPSSFTRDDNASIIRCKLSSPFVPFDVYTNQCVVTVNRRFYYFADSPTKQVFSGGTLLLDLNPSWTGGNPSFQWETSNNGGSSWSEIPSATSSEISTTPVNGQIFRCKITLEDCNQHQYSRNNSVIIASVSSVAYTVTVTVTLTTAKTRPIYYSQEIEKTGSSVGTVICVPKPSGYVNNPSANTDDLPQWKISTTGHVDSFSPSFAPSSVVTSGSAYNSNKPSWADSSYISPKWRLNQDRFRGFIELRGQWLKKSEFPELYRIIGDSYGSTSGSNGNFRLPNLYAKTVMGTGNVDNNTGSISIQPRWAPNGVSGGDKNIPGSTGGYWVYWSTYQLPPGSPGILSAEDGRSGVDFPNTFTFGNFRTSGFEDIFAILRPSFGGTVTYDVPEILATATRVPSHSHQGVSIGVEEYPVVLTGGCNTKGKSYPLGNINPLFPESRPATGFVDDGPAYVSNPGRSHSHGLTLNTTEEPLNGYTANHGEGTGSGGGSDQLVGRNFSMSSAGMSIETAELKMTTQSRPIFDDSLKFYFRNAESLPLRVPYFRLRYMIKAY